MQELRFLFWNLNKNSPFEEIKNIVENYSIDILILSEVKFNLTNLIQELNHKNNDFYLPNPIFQCEKIKFITRFKDDYLIPVSEERRYSIGHLKIPLFEEILICGVHIPDKLHNSEVDRDVFSGIFVNEIKRIESVLNINKTIVVGDFNMSPFETSMIKSTTFHAVSSAKVAERISRTVGEREYSFFYNPMWSLQGDIKNDVAGSYYYNTSNHENYHWNLFDQVLIRPSLLPNFDRTSLQILDNDGEKSLLTKNGLPDTKFSDHLPLFFSFKFDI